MVQDTPTSTPPEQAKLPMSGKILKSKPRGGRYPHMWVVLVELRDNNLPYVVWVYNEQSKGFGNGDYYQDLPAAETAYVDR